MTESMTESEAIERLNCLRLYMQITDKNSDSKFLDEDYEANAMAINALEKQEKIKEVIANANKWSKEDIVVNIVVKVQAFCEIEKILRSDKE